MARSWAQCVSLSKHTPPLGKRASHVSHAHSRWLGGWGFGRCFILAHTYAAYVAYALMGLQPSEDGQRLVGSWSKAGQRAGQRIVRGWSQGGHRVVGHPQGCNSHPMPSIHTHAHTHTHTHTHTLDAWRYRMLGGTEAGQRLVRGWLGGGQRVVTGWSDTHTGVTPIP